MDQLPSDAIRPREAIEILAGRRLPGGSTAWNRHSDRLRAAAAAGGITRYPVGRTSRYSRAEVEALKQRLAKSGIASTASRHRTRMVRAWRPTASNLVTVEEAAQLAGVSRSTVYGWCEKGLYGAVRLGSRHFLEREQIPRPMKRARADISRVVPCATCGALVEQPLRWPRKYCPRCRRAARIRQLEAARASLDPAERGRRISAGNRRAWTEGKRGRTSVEPMLEAVKEVWRSPKRNHARVNKQTVTRYGHELGADRSEKLRQGSNRRKTLAMDRSQRTRELEDQVVALWSESLSQMEMANLCHVTPARISQIAKDLGLPARPRGRRPRNV